MTKFKLFLTSFLFTFSTGNVILSISQAHATQVDCKTFLAQPPKDHLGGLVTNQLDFSVEALVEAYANGIFPWKDLGTSAEWYRPPTRGLLFLDQYYESSSLKKLIRQGKFEVTFDQAFADVIRACRKAHAKEGEWISDRFVAAYTELQRAGHAHSVEVWSRNPKTGERELAGGLYGVFVKGVYAGESMFRNYALKNRSNNAPKVAMSYLVQRLKANGHLWIDTQMVTEGTEPMGAREISRDEYMKLLREAQAKNLEF